MFRPFVFLPAVQQWRHPVVPDPLIPPIINIYSNITLIATPFEYSRFRPMALRISRISDNTNHSKYSLSLVFSLSLTLFPFVPPLSLSRDAPCLRALSLAFASCCLSAHHHSPSGIKTFEDETPAGVLHRATLSYGRKICVKSMSSLVHTSLSLSFLLGDAESFEVSACIVINLNGYIV